MATEISRRDISRVAIAAGDGGPAFIGRTSTTFNAMPFSRKRERNFLPINVSVYRRRIVKPAT